MPSSKYLARDAVRRIVDRLKEENREPVSILELGPGTGAFTERILPRLAEKDRLDTVELNAYFCKILRRRFRDNPKFRLHHTDFLSYESDRHYDFVISSLPYESIPSRVTRMMWEQKLDFCKPGAYIIYYKYVNFNHFRSRYEKHLVRSYCEDKKLVFLNMPPAQLLTLRIGESRNGINGTVQKQIGSESTGKNGANGAHSV
ncbi:rRNA adenine N-6-methyltransferase family protein [Balneolales bacterium ANBcel1]|nr:rRNA adenine N-6-methyltransferase family protein [Balneolales bacterium ANBcel1]